MSSRKCRIDRRQFLKLGAAASALSLSGCVSAEKNRTVAQETVMRYRQLGSTGLRVSEVSFGAHGLDNPALSPAAIDACINTFATSGRRVEVDPPGRTQGPQESKPWSMNQSWESGLCNNAYETVQASVIIRRDPAAGAA